MFSDRIRTPIFAAVRFQDFQRRFPLFREFGIFPEIYFDAATAAAATQDTLSAMRGAIREAGMRSTVHAPFWDLSLGSSDEGLRKLSVERLASAVRVAGILDARNVVFHSGYNETAFLAEGKEAWIRKLCDSIGAVTDMARSAGVTMSLENVYDPTPETMIAAASALSREKLGLCFDTGHFSVFGKAPLEEWLDGIAPFLREMHLHSNFGTGDDHLALDDGRVDFERILSRASEKKTNPILTIENKKDDYLVRSVRLLRSERFGRLVDSFETRLDR